MKANRRTGEIGRPAEGLSVDFNHWHAVKEQALAEKRVRENQIAEGKLIDAETERRRDVQKLTVLRSRLCSLGATISPQLEGLDAAGRQELIDKAVENILQQLAAE